MKQFVIAILITTCRGIHFVSRFLPTRFVLWGAASIGGIVGYFCSKDEQISIAQLRYALSGNLSKTKLFSPLKAENGICGADHKFIARRVFRHIGESVGELLLWERFLPSKSLSTPAIGRRETIRGTSTESKVFDEIKESKRGAVGLSAHLGSFEILAAYLAYCGLPCSVIGRSPNYPLLEKFISNFRKAYGVNVIWGNGPEAPRQIINAIRRGQVVCALIDQDTKLKSEFSPFFGLDAASPIAPVQLAIRYKLPIFTSFIVRTAPMTHQVTTEIIPYDAGDPEAKNKILTKYNERLEKLIRLYPEQYIWWHRRWRRRPGIDYSQSPQLLRTGTEYMQWLSTLEQPNAAVS